MEQKIKVKGDKQECEACLVILSDLIDSIVIKQLKLNKYHDVKQIKKEDIRSQFGVNIDFGTLSLIAIGN